jgi:hypothetical protein
MFRYLPIIAGVTILANLIVIIFRVGDWDLERWIQYTAWTLLFVIQIIVIYYTWHSRNQIPNTSMILWTVGVLLVPVILIPWWFLRIYPDLKLNLD